MLDSQKLICQHVTHIGFKGMVWKQVSFNISEFTLMIFLHQAFCHFSVYL